jgi:hypothetical protein
VGRGLEVNDAALCLFRGFADAGLGKTTYCRSQPSPRQTSTPGRELNPRELQERPHSSGIEHGLAGGWGLMALPVPTNGTVAWSATLKVMEAIFMTEPSCASRCQT